MELEDASDIVVFTPYQWRDWSIVCSRDCLYLWNEFCAIELSNVSNGWFRYLVDNKLATMYSSRQQQRVDRTPSVSAHVEWLQLEHVDDQPVCITHTHNTLHHTTENS